MTNLISGADALRALADGKEVERKSISGWIDASNLLAYEFFNDKFNFRLKPTTIALNIEIPAPFEPKEGDIYFYLTNYYECGYDSRVYDSKLRTFYHTQAWRTEVEAKQVVEALRGALRG